MSMKTASRVVSPRRRRQNGQELLEFGLMLTLLMPLLVGSFVTGFSIIRGIQTNQMTRDMASLYIHGADFSTYPMQELAQRLARGLNLQIGSSFSSNVQSNTSNSGDGLVTVTRVMYVGPTSGTSCQAVGAANCTNHDKFVFLERIQFGNGTLASQTSSFLGNPGAGASIANDGVVSNYLIDSNAALPTTANAAMQALWQVNSGGRTPLADGQVVYVVESYIQALNLNLGIYKSTGTYARYFF
jgi:hypothetical protein